MKPVLKNLGISLAFLAICALVGLTVGCPIKSTTGIPCPGCGLTRGCMALLRLDFREAFRCNPLSFAVPFVFFAFIFKDSCKPLGFFSKTQVQLVVLILALGIYIWRMCTLFPHTPPMNFKENSLFGKIVHLLLQ